MSVVKIGSEFSFAGYQAVTSSTVLRNGDFALTGTRATGSIAGTMHLDALVVKGDGAPAPSAIGIAQLPFEASFSSNLYSAIWPGGIGALPDGRFVMAYALYAGTWSHDLAMPTSYLHQNLFRLGNPATNSASSPVQHRADSFDWLSIPRDPDTLSNPILGELENGFAMSWSDTSWDAQGNPHIAHRIQPFYNNGSLSPGAFTFGESTLTTSFGRPEIAGFLNGGFIVTYTKSTNGLPPWEHDIYGQFFDANGAPGAIVKLSEPGLAIREEAPEVSAIGDEFVAVWNEVDQFDPAQEYAIRGNVFDASGNPLAGFYVSTPGSFVPFSHKVAGFPDGRFVVVWLRPGPELIGQELVGLVFAPDGTPMGDEFVIDQAGTEIGHVTVAAREDGRFLVTWFDGSAASGQQSRAQMYDLEGTGYFSEELDYVNFNELDAGQKFAINSGQSLYDAMAGNDKVLLPNIANYQVTPTVSWNPDQIFNAGGGDDHVSGGDGKDIIDGGAGNDTIYGSKGNDDLRGGDGADEFNFRNGIGTFAAGTEQTLFGGETFFDREYDQQDVLLLPGRPNDYTFAVDFHGGHSVALTRTTIATTGSQLPNDVKFHTRAIERVEFQQAFNNAVTLTAGNKAVEMMALAAESFGPAARYHDAEPLAWENGGGNSIIDTAIARGWRPLSAMELGIGAADFGQISNSDGILRYSFVSGHYQAKNERADSSSEANALVLAGVVNGERTLAIAFRGDDEASDTADFGNAADHYEKFEPLVSAIQRYLANDDNGIRQVLVSGNGIGGSAAQYFAQETPDSGSYRVLTYSSGSPGAEVLSNATSIEHFIHTHDPIAYLSEASTAGTFALKALARNPFVKAFVDVILPKIQNKDRNGGEVYIDSDAAWGFPHGLFAEHDARLYATNLQKLLQYARDTESPFHDSQLANALAADSIYSGSSIRVGVGSPTSHAVNVYAGNDYVLGTAFGLQGWSGQGNGARINWDPAYALNPLAPKTTVIDGGVGGNNTLALYGSKDDFALTNFGPDFEFNVIYHYNTQSQAGVVDFDVARVHRVQKVVYVDGISFQPAPGFGGHLSVQAAAPTDSIFIESVDGTPLTVQTPAPGQTNIQVDFSFDYLDTEAHDITVQGSDQGDIVAIGSGNVTIVGGAADDIFAAKNRALTNTIVVDGGAGDDIINTAAGNDRITGGLGSDRIDGGGGSDTAVFSGLLSASTLSFLGGSAVRIVGPNSTDTVNNVETLIFDDATLVRQAAAWSIDFGMTGGGRWIAGTGDFNDNGTGDLLVRDANTGAVDSMLLSNGGSGGTGAIGVLSGGWQLAGTGDFNDDGTADVLLENAFSREVNTWIVQNGQWSASGAVGVLVGAWQLAGTGDFSADGTTDVLLRNTATGEVATWIVRNGQWSASGAVGLEAGGWRVIGTGDVNNDNTADVLLFNGATNEVNAWIVGNGQWAASTACGVLSGAWQVKGIGDFNGDGTGDVLLHNTATSEVAAWLLQNGTWTNSISLGAYETASSPVAIGDFNNDGRSDLFWQNLTNGHAVEWLISA